MRFPGFIGPSYTSQSVNVDCQRTVNLFPEINALGTGKEREVAALVPTPGLRRLLTLPTSPVRGMWRASNGQVFAVGGQKLYRIASDWSYTEIGSLNTDTGYVSIADNGLQLMLVDGTNGYTWTIATNTFAVISDEAFPSPAPTHVCYQDGYFIFNYTGTGQWGITGLNDVTFDALDITTAEGSPDALICIISSNQTVYAIGTQSIEAYYNSGAADFPFNRIQGAVIDTGCVAPYSVAELVGSIIWVGGDSNGSGVVYMMQGQQPKRISTPAIESVIRGLSPASLSAATSWTYQQGGHLFYCLNLPTTNTTYCYDVSTEMWHERKYLNLWSTERHRAEHHAIAYGVSIVGDYESGKIYALDPDTYTDDGTSIVRERTAPHVSKDLTLVRHNGFELDMETGVGLSGEGQGSDPKVILTWSDDGGHTWSNERYADAGKLGNRKTRVKWRRLGMSRDRVYRVKITDPVKVVLIGAEIELEEGAS
jgi:hypothetical protein